MMIQRSREELARYAANKDVHSITGIFLEGDDLDATGQPDLMLNRLGNPPNDILTIWGIRNWGIENKHFNDFFADLNPDHRPHLEDFAKNVVNAQRNAMNPPLPPIAAVPQQQVVETMIQRVPGQFTFNSNTATVTDIRQARLIRRLDLTEWISIPNNEILYWVVTENEGDKWEFPMGRITVWVKGSAIVDHTRTKTMKTFVRGEIANKLKNQDFDTSLDGIRRVFFDVDAEDMFSSNRGDC